MRRNLLAGLAVVLVGCDAGPSPPPPADQNKAVLIAYTSDAALTHLDPATASYSAHREALDPTAPKFSEFVKSGYETADVFKTRIASITGEGRRYVLIAPALLTYDADTQLATFCPKWSVPTNPECVQSSKSSKVVDIDSVVAGPFYIASKLDVRANKLKAPLLPITIPVPLDAAKRTDTAGKARLAIIYTLDKPYDDGKFTTTEGTTYNNIQLSKITVRRVVVYEQNGAVLAAKEF